MSDSIDVSDYIYDPVHGFLPKSEAPFVDKNDFQNILKKMNPILRTLLVCDGTVTKFLEAFLWEPIYVEKLFQKEVLLEKNYPLLKTKKAEPGIIRRILLRGTITQKVYTYAESVIRIDLLDSSIKRDLSVGRLGMGELLRDRRLETFREIIECGENKAGDVISKYFEIKPEDIVYYRKYRIIIKGNPAILITEMFFEPHFSGKGSSS